MSYANRGMELEKVIEVTNKYYRNLEIADIRKVPTNVKITSNKGGKVTGFTQRGEWVDFAGVQNGQAIAFDAKQTKGKSLPLQNIHPQQIDFLKSWHKNGAYAFLLVYFSDMDKYYKLPFEVLEKAITGELEGPRKSISLKVFELYGINIDLVDGILKYL